MEVFTLLITVDFTELKKWGECKLVNKLKDINNALKDEFHPFERSKYLDSSYDMKGLFCFSAKVFRDFITVRTNKNFKKLIWDQIGEYVPITFLLIEADTDETVLFCSSTKEEYFHYNKETILGEKYIPDFKEERLGA